MIVTNHPNEGSILNFSDELDRNLCEISNIRFTNRKDVTNSKVVEYEVPRRTLINCKSLPANHTVDLVFRNWAEYFNFKAWAKNSELFEKVVKCDWTLEGLNTYCSEHKNECTDDKYFILK